MSLIFPDQAIPVVTPVGTEKIFAARASDGKIVYFTGSQLFAALLELKTVNGESLIGDGNITTGGGGGTWGSITGTLANQSDLKAALDAKVTTPTPLIAGVVLGTTLETNVLGMVGYSQSPMGDQLVMYNFGGQISTADPIDETDAANKKYVDERVGFVDLETPAGAIDGTNATYTLANTPVAGSLHLYLNGLLQEAGAGNDYTLSGTTITTADPLEAGDKLRASYRK